jgi:hypothetical protein
MIVVPVVLVLVREPIPYIASVYKGIDTIPDRLPDTEAEV